MSTIRKKRPARFGYPYILLALLIVIVLVGLIIYHTTNLFGNHNHVTASTYTKGEVGTTSSNTGTTSQTSSGGTSSQSSTSQPGDQKSNTDGSTSAAPITPTGDFVSAHGSSSYPIDPNTPLTSVCNTTPGATCQIEFNQNGTTHSLPSETSDRGGAAYWNDWTPKSIGLTSGTWQIKANATSGGQTATATDAMALVVSQ